MVCFTHGYTTDGSGINHMKYNNNESRPSG